LIWTACVLMSVGLFVYQVGSRTNTFYKYNTNVDVEVIYTKEMQFPTVTLCNQNAYRSVFVVWPFRMVTISVSINGTCFDHWHVVIFRQENSTYCYNLCRDVMIFYYSKLTSWSFISINRHVVIFYQDKSTCYNILLGQVNFSGRNLMSCQCPIKGSMHTYIYL
jgi:hypothetical protein